MRTTDYDAFGRVRRVQTTIEGTVYTQRMTYDAFGRAFQSFDASTDPNSPKGQLFQYSADGFPIRTREAANGLVGVAYREVLALSPRGQVRRERLWESGGGQNLFVTRRYDDQTGRLMEIGSGMGTSAAAADTRFQRWDYTYDKNGNLTRRWNRAGLFGAAYDDEESFDYDNRDRLDAVRRTRLNGTAINTVSMDLAYDGLGNITFKTGRGSYAYKSGTATTGCSRVAGPHAVSVIGGKSYCYDLNGNNTEVRSGGTVIRSIVYTGYDLPERIVRNESGINQTAEFRYGPDRARYKRVDNGSGPVITTCATPNTDRLICHGYENGDASGGAVQGVTTFYVGNVEFINRAGTSIVKRYIGDFLVISTQNNTDTHDILLRDGLGSIDAIVSESGVIRQRLSFDAHGSRRVADPPGNSALWNLLDPFSAANANTNSTTRGYTGHEQLDGVGLIHMNARLYDPEIGRFIQADSMVEPEATQGLNRYSYVL
ncbi:MAG: RHS repeat-associated core domain-containing protein, partial [Pseudomonadota bacterium]